jgi:hypothetical protein
MVSPAIHGQPTYGVPVIRVPNFGQSPRPYLCRTLVNRLRLFPVESVNILGPGVAEHDRRIVGGDRKPSSVVAYGDNILEVHTCEGVWPANLARLLSSVSSVKSPVTKCHNPSGACCYENPDQRSSTKLRRPLWPIAIRNDVSYCQPVASSGEVYLAKLTGS